MDFIDEQGRRTSVSAANPLPVAGGTGGSGGQTDGLTNTQLRASPVPVSGPLTDGQLRATPVPVSGPLTEAQLRSTTSTFSTAAAATGAAVLLAADTGRKGGKIINLSAGTLYLTYGNVAAGVPSATRYRSALAQNEAHVIDSGYAGDITGAWSATGGNGAMIWQEK